MQEDISINEFEAMMTTRVHCVLLKDKGIIKESCNKNEIALKYAIVANKILADYGLKDLKAIFRSTRAYIIFVPTGRIACEICVDGDYDGEMIRRSKAVLMSRRGYVRSKTLRDLADYTASRGKTKYSNLSKGEVDAKRKEHYQDK